MKYKFHTYDNDPCTFIVIDSGLLLYLHQSGRRPHRTYQGSEWACQGGRWAGEFKFADEEDARAFAAEILPAKAVEVEEVEKIVERKKD